MDISQLLNIRSECEASHEYAAFFLEQLQEFRSEGHLVDVILCAEGKEIPCHRLVLSACSDYFRAMFRGGHSESKKEKIEMGGVGAEALQLLVDYAYRSKFTITGNNIQSVFEAANMLQVESVEEECEEILTDCLSPETCLATWALADKVSCRDLLERAKSHAVRKFEEVCRMEQFLELPVDFLKTYISDDGLHAKKEERVLDGIMLWVRHDLKERQSHLKELLECVRLSHVNQDYLKNIMKTDKELLAAVPGIEELISDKSRPKEPRHIHQEEILVLGGHTLTPEKWVRPNCNLHRLDPHCDSIGITPLPEPLQKSFGIAACVFNNDVIVTGGHRSQCEAWRYKPSLDSWTELCDLNRERHSHGMAVVQGRVYAVGGEEYEYSIHGICGYQQGGLSNVEVYSDTTERWGEVASLQQGVSYFGITACCDKIYVFGGRMSNKRETDVAQCYDPTEDAWTFVKPLPKAVMNIKACTVDSKIYLVGGKLDHVLCYDPQEDSYEEMADPLVPWDDCSATVCGSEIYITGGCNKHPSGPQFCCMVPSATVQCYNVSSDTLIMVEDLPLRLRAHNSVTIAKPGPSPGPIPSSQS